MLPSLDSVLAKHSNNAVDAVSSGQDMVLVDYDAATDGKVYEPSQSYLQQYLVRKFADFGISTVGETCTEILGSIRFGRYR